MRQKKWDVVVPFRGLECAKTRLAVECKRDLALAFLRDTLAALSSSSRIASLIVVSRDAGLSKLIDVPVVEDEENGIDAALEVGFRSLSVHRARSHSAVVLPDLPALRSGDIDTFLDVASYMPRAFVPDAAGSGTTCLSARDGVMASVFGVKSAHHHSQLGYAAILLGVPSLRLDVDTVEDLMRAAQLGVGNHTTKLLTNDEELRELSNRAFSENGSAARIGDN
ncbi:2-phospho-L-lactate guanylyltransferase [Rhodococcus qingshengii]|uniref:2-phospho-L-lactate guanylyltransferase n=1 Tax=Rhodococcus qingshengii TaxID=334542 RepID=UPI0010A6751E|nr:2-phospho-L-lactate guanylyltransferase [Rhodococcus qingshengii]THJ64488.1 2-phospho-L-lactate guanylyltransferase [Rhodococcus qingshengii]